MRLSALTALLLSALAGSAAAQATGMPYYYAPYRAFEHHELGGTISFPSGSGTGFEGLYGFGKGRFDIGIRGGAYVPSGEGASTQMILGAHGRGMFVLHSENFPLDGSFVVGAGTSRGFKNVNIPAGLTFGRRLNIEDSNVSLVPYGQPTLMLTAGSDQDTKVLFGLGLGIDARVSEVLDLRLSVGLGDIEGVAISVVWVN